MSLESDSDFDFTRTRGFSRLSVGGSSTDFCFESSNDFLVKSGTETECSENIGMFGCGSLNDDRSVGFGARSKVFILEMESNGPRTFKVVLVGLHAGLVVNKVIVNMAPKNRRFF